MFVLMTTIRPVLLFRMLDPKNEKGLDGNERALARAHALIKRLTRTRSNAKNANPIRG